MTTDPFLRKLAVLASALMILGGASLVFWLLGNRPNSQNNVISAASDGEPIVELTPTPILDPLLVTVEGFSGELSEAISLTLAAQPALQIVSADTPSVTLRLDWEADDGALLL